MKKRNIIILLTSFAALFLTGVSAVHAEKPTQLSIKEITANCDHCHGPSGCEPLTGLMPKICGQNQEYLEMTLMQFRDGVRPSPIMQQTTKILSDKLIKQIAAHYAQEQRSGK